MPSWSGKDNHGDKAGDGYHGHDDDDDDDDDDDGAGGSDDGSDDDDDDDESGDHGNITWLDESRQWLLAAAYAVVCKLPSSENPPPRRLPS